MAKKKPHEKSKEHLEEKRENPDRRQAASGGHAAHGHSEHERREGFRRGEDKKKEQRW